MSVLSAQQTAHTSVRTAQVPSIVAADWDSNLHLTQKHVKVDIYTTRYETNSFSQQSENFQLVLLFCYICWITLHQLKCFRSAIAKKVTCMDTIYCIFNIVEQSRVMFQISSLL